MNKEVYRTKVGAAMPETRNVYVRVNANGVGTLSEISDYLEARIKELEREE